MDTKITLGEAINEVFNADFEIEQDDDDNSNYETHSGS